MKSGSMTQVDTVTFNMKLSGNLVKNNLAMTTLLGSGLNAWDMN